MHSQDSLVLSLFSGGMGMDIGLARSGLCIGVSQDLDRSCIATMRANSKHFILPGDIRTMFADDPTGRFLMSPAGVQRGDAFLVVGGPPCQSFSNAGKRLGLNDLRGTLFQEFAKAIETSKPRFFVMENVAALASKSMPGVLNLMCNRFKSIGYSFVYGILDASDFGAPQIRKRMIFIGSRDGEHVSLPAPTHSDDPSSGLKPKSTLRDAIGDLMHNEGPCAEFSPKTLKYIRMVPEGGNWRHLPESICREAMGSAFYSGGGKTGFFRRLQWDRPSPTLVTSPTQKMSLLCHPKEHRPLSVKEYARIQGFPDNWSFQGSLTSQYRQIGNAVAVPMAEAIGHHLLRIARMGEFLPSTRRAA